MKSTPYKTLSHEKREKDGRFWMISVVAVFFSFATILSLFQIGGKQNKEQCDKEHVRSAAARDTDRIHHKGDYE